jgi:hypothetical protein
MDSMVVDVTKRHPTTASPPANTMIQIRMRQAANATIRTNAIFWQELGKSLRVRPINSSERNATQRGELRPPTDPSKSAVDKVEDLSDRKTVNLHANATINDDRNVSEAIGNSPIRRPTNTSEPSVDEVPANTTIQMTANNGDFVDNTSLGQYPTNTPGTVAAVAKELSQSNDTSGRIVDNVDNSMDRHLATNHLPANNTINIDANIKDANDNPTDRRLTNTSEPNADNLGKRSQAFLDHHLEKWMSSHVAQQLDVHLQRLYHGETQPPNQSTHRKLAGTRSCLMSPKS